MALISPSRWSVQGSKHWMNPGRSGSCPKTACSQNNDSSSSNTVTNLPYGREENRWQRDWSDGPEQQQQTTTGSRSTPTAATKTMKDGDGNGGRRSANLGTRHIDPRKPPPGMQMHPVPRTENRPSPDTFTMYTSGIRDQPAHARPSRSVGDTARQKACPGRRMAHGLGLLGSTVRYVRIFATFPSFVSAAHLDLHSAAGRPREAFRRRFR